MFKFGCELLFASLHSITAGRNLEFICTCFFSLLVLVRTVKPRANGRNIVGCYMLRPFAHPVACCWMLLRVVAQSLKPVPVFLLFRDRRSVAQQCWIRLQSSSNVVGAGPRTLITHGLQRLIGSIFPTMHCRSQHCWEFLHRFAHQCQHARNNSQHCWHNNVGSYVIINHKCNTHYKCNKNQP